MPVILFALLFPIIFTFLAFALYLCDALFGKVLKQCVYNAM